MLNCLLQFVLSNKFVFYVSHRCLHLWKGADSLRVKSHMTKKRQRYLGGGVNPKTKKKNVAKSQQVSITRQKQ